MADNDTAAAGPPMKTPRSRAFTDEEASRTLADAMAQLPTFVSPQTAAAIQATENMWRRIELSEGLLTSAEAADALGMGCACDPLISQLRRAGHLISVTRRGQTVYPTFQFDPDLHQTRALVTPLIEIAVKNGYSHTDLLFWMYSPTTYFLDERRPIDHLDSVEELVEVARNAMGIIW